MHPVAVEADCADDVEIRFCRVWRSSQAFNCNAQEYQSITSFVVRNNLVIKAGNTGDTLGNRRQGFVALNFGNDREGLAGPFSISGAVIEHNTIVNADAGDYGISQGIVVVRGTNAAASCTYAFRYNVIDAADTSRRIIQHFVTDGSTVNATIDGNVWGMDGTSIGADAYRHQYAAAGSTRVNWTAFSAGSWTDHESVTQDANSVFADPLLDAAYRPTATGLPTGVGGLTDGYLDAASTVVGWADAA